MGSVDVFHEDRLVGGGRRGEGNRTAVQSHANRRGSQSAGRSHVIRRAGRGLIAGQRPINQILRQIRIAKPGRTLQIIRVAIGSIADFKHLIVITNAVLTIQAAVNYRLSRNGC